MIFVFECKNYNAEIGIDPTNPMRFSARYKNGKEFYFRSPIMQNNGHIKNIIRHIDAAKGSRMSNQNKAGEYEIYNVVVFSPKADISKFKNSVVNAAHNMMPNSAKETYIIQPIDIPNILRKAIATN